MKRYLLLLTVVLSLSVTTQPANAQDGFFTDARTLEKGTFLVGVQPVVLTAQDDFMTVFRGSYGLTRGLTGHFKVGAFQEDVYVGGHLEYNLMMEPERAISAGLLAGIYTQSETGLKFGLNLSKHFDPVSVYTGLNYQPLLIDGEVALDSILLPIGLDYHLRNVPVDLLLEANIPLNDDAEYLEAITFGAKIYLN